MATPTHTSGDLNPVVDATWLRATAKQIGFELCGVVQVDNLTASELPGLTLNEWLARGYAGEMRYLHDPRRSDLAQAFPEARSIIVCAIHYDQPELYSIEAAAAPVDEPRGWISRYAWGDDYHEAIGVRLEQLVVALRQRHDNAFTARVYVDTGPISERALARLAGLGWQGKNTCLINAEIGSWLFLGVIVTSLTVRQEEAAGPPPDLCGHCRLCLEACPTEALVEPYVMDARRCISYLTIELRGSIPEELRSRMGWQVFGCDICQDVCPWNQATVATPRGQQIENSEQNTGQDEKQAGASEFAPRDGLVAPKLAWLLQLSEDDFRKTFRGSPIKRTKWRGLLRNACVAAGNALAKMKAHGSADAPDAALLRTRLTELLASEDSTIAEHARWALAQAMVTRSGGVVQSTDQD